MGLRGGTSAGHDRESALSPRRKHLIGLSILPRALLAVNRDSFTLHERLSSIVVTTPDIMKFASSSFSASISLAIMGGCLLCGAAGLTI